MARPLSIQFQYVNDLREDEPFQYPMFAPAKTLREAVSWSFDERGAPTEALWKRKREEDPALTRSVRTQGVQRPISVSHNLTGLNLWDGHHRLASAPDEQEVPLQWSDRAF
jgi:hypothetical protein